MPPLVLALDDTDSSSNEGYRGDVEVEVEVSFDANEDENIKEVKTKGFMGQGVRDILDEGEFFFVIHSFIHSFSSLSLFFDIISYYLEARN